MRAESEFRTHTHRYDLRVLQLPQGPYVRHPGAEAEVGQVPQLPQGQYVHHAEAA
jgi:hypothetical protein